MSSRALRKTVLCMALGFGLVSIVSMPSAYAANTDGSVVGRAEAGAQITINNPETGFTRTVSADADGNYRIPLLPVGSYTLRASKGGVAIGQPVAVRVSLGNATTVNLVSRTAADGTTTLETVEVIGTGVVSAVDVTSTESAMNITSEELDRLPVGRSATAVALLAPGVSKGDADSGGLAGGTSFGGSSVSENTVYINGLNVTDFYNRIGFSSVPYSFFEEFQVKTGGYSVEFGRTTGGVINAVTKSGTNEFHFGTEAIWEPNFLQAEGTDRYLPNDDKLVSVSRDESDRRNLNVYASGPIIKDKLFFYALYELRDFDQTFTTDETETQIAESNAGDDFWGAKVDWQINDSHSLEALVFSDQNETIRDVYAFDPITGKRGANNGTIFTLSGGTNWALTYTGYLTDALSMKVLYGETERERAEFSANDVGCNRFTGNPLTSSTSSPSYGCPAASAIRKGLDNREAFRTDFEWLLGDHLVRFGLDREVNTSDFKRKFPGPGGLRYEVSRTTPGTVLNGGIVPAGVIAKIRTRRFEVDGTFETVNNAYYLEDNWSVTPNFVLNAGIRVEGFDNKNEAGDSYIKVDNMLAPRLGFSWDFNGNQRSKIYGNLGRYFLPVANVINVLQGGGFLDERVFYAFNGFENFVFNGVTYRRPILGPQIGGVDVSQGNGNVGDLRGEVDADIDPVYQDELILGFQSMIDEKWSYGVRGIYRKLNNAIDDMEISDSGFCRGDVDKAGGDGYGDAGSYVGFVMANPGKNATVYVDTNCDGTPDSFTTIDTSRAGWALYDDDGTYVGQRGWVKPKRTYKALEFVIDRAWDKQWAFNASYTLAYSEGNAEGPVNSDVKGGFSDAGRTENFDNPFVNLNSEGSLPNDRRHQFKFRGTYAFNDAWSIGATLNTQSGQPISPYGVGNPFDDTQFFSRYLCVQNCDTGVPSDDVFTLSERGSGGRLPWTTDLGANLTYRRSIGPADLNVSFTVFNLLNLEHQNGIDEQFESEVGSRNDFYLTGTSYQSPRSAQLRIALDF